ncbi:hypothetical protein EV196_101575 [Mariniflexile fucanivorans]|uniref:Uncharacterized protein n=1 Tax=Mariniflexile fucanivorans TaxID=264023 RepID=A0A4R1RRR7_9FLAO|nr:hypothetical protein [Mariniflexile fucanivorans]TCL69141.1 hypothetical protein EV196_101575 [Mariniflexile fucanivorans]
MKKLYILFFILITSTLTAQNSEMISYKLDDLVSLDVPKNFVESDTIVDGVEIHQIRFKTKTFNFIVQKVLFENEDQKESLSRLPYDYTSLIDEYNRVIARMRYRVPYYLKSKTLVEKEGFTGYNLKFANDLETPTYEAEFYLLNKNLYTFFYASDTQFNNDVKTELFNSVKINTKQDISQYLGKPPKYRYGYVLATYFFLSLFVIWVIIISIKIYRKKRGKSSIFHE